MTPYDGSGYGISMYWRNTMKDIANESGESCPCWNNDEPLIKFIPPKSPRECTDVNDFKIAVQCSQKTDECKKNFSATEIELIRKFKEFYKV